MSTGHSEDNSSIWPIRFLLTKPFQSKANVGSFALADALTGIAIVKIEVNSIVNGIESGKSMYSQKQRS